MGGSWRGGRVVEGARLEIVYTAKPYRGFESLSLRQICLSRHFMTTQNPHDLWLCGFFVVSSSFTPYRHVPSFLTVVLAVCTCPRYSHTVKSGKTRHDAACGRSIVFPGIPSYRFQIPPSATLSPKTGLVSWPMRKGCTCWSTTPGNTGDSTTDSRLSAKP
jgi:hypothetical protein